MGGISRSQITVAVNNDKTGYSLTAGSYSIRASSSQHSGQITLTTNPQDFTMSSVTTTRASSYFGGCSTSQTARTDNTAIAWINSSTTVRFFRDATTGNTDAAVEVAEFF